MTTIRQYNFLLLPFAIMLALCTHPLYAHAKKDIAQSLREFQQDTDAKFKRLQQALKSLQANTLKKGKQIKSLTKQLKAVKTQHTALKQKVQKQKSDAETSAKKFSSALSQTKVKYTSCTQKTHVISATGNKGNNNLSKVICSTQLTPPTDGILVAQLTGNGHINAGNSPNCRYAIRFNNERKTADYLPGEAWLSSWLTKTYKPVSPISSTRAIRVKARTKQRVSIHMQPMWGTTCAVASAKLHVLFFPTPRNKR